jgi:guanylate kinase
LVILSSPSGTGKTTIARRILAAREDVAFSISATTRPRRPRERDGVDYHFLTREEFVERRERGEFLEWAEYNGRLYGTLQADVDALLAGGRHVILDIEVQGAQQVRARRKDVVAIFVLPPSGEVLLSRLRGRGSEDPQEVARRVVQAGRELEQATSYDHLVVNDVLDDAVAQVNGIIDGEASRTVRQPELENRIEQLRRELAAIVTPKER